MADLLIEMPRSIEAELKAQVRILLADGEATLRATTANVLRYEGYDVVACNRTQEALDTLRHRAFDIVLVDLELPQVPGLTLLKAALATNPDTIGIVMTDALIRTRSGTGSKRTSTRHWRGWASAKLEASAWAYRSASPRSPAGPPPRRSMRQRTSRRASRNRPAAPRKPRAD